MLKRLEADGLIERGEQKEALLTEAGRELERRAQCIPEQLFSSTGLTEQDAADLRDAVRRLTDALNASTSNPSLLND